MKGVRIEYSPEERAFLFDNGTLPRRELTALFNTKFKRHVSVDNIKSHCHRRGIKTGRTGTFPKGNVPPNKGKKMPYNANSARTQFKKGSRPPNQKPMGSERTCSKDGYIYIKVDKVNPHTGHRGHFVLKHRYLWEQKNGPVPAGHCLKSIDGNRTNTDPENWTVIPLSMRAQLSGRSRRNYDKSPDSLKPVIFATAKVADTLNHLKKQKA